MNEGKQALRIDIREANGRALQAMRAFSDSQAAGTLDRGLRELIHVRASQINGCAFCLEMHTREAREHGEEEHRLHLLSVWREAPYYSEAERAALELTEAVTRIGDGGVPEALTDRVRQHFSEEQYVDLLMAINIINSWNRLMIAIGALVPHRARTNS